MLYYFAKKWYTIHKRAKEVQKVNKSRFGGLDPELIQTNMLSMISRAMDLKNRLDMDEKFEEIGILCDQMKACYRTLADIQNALELEKYDSGNIRPCVFSATAALEDIVSVLRNRYVRRNDDIFKWNIEKGVECVADPERFKSCVMNLLVNSFQYATNPGSDICVKLSMKRRGNFAEVIVCDNSWVYSHESIKDIIANAQYGGFAVLKRFCESVGTKHTVMHNDVNDEGGLWIKIEVPLKPENSEGTLSLKTSETPEHIDAFSPWEFLIYKLPDARIKL